MPPEQKETFDKFAKDISFIRRWWPVALVLWAVVTFIVKGTLFVNNDLAKKSDIDKLSKDVISLTVQVKTMNDNFSILKSGNSAFKDSIRVVLTNDRDYTDNKIKAVKRSLQFVTETYKIVDGKRVYEQHPN